MFKAAKYDVNNYPYYTYYMGQYPDYYYDPYKHLGALQKDELAE